MTLHIFSYNEYSEGATQLATASRIKRIKHEQSRYRGAPEKTVINWGAAEIPVTIQQSQIINLPERVRAVSNKCRFFQFMEETDARMPPWTSLRRDALDWFRDGKTVVARAILNGHSGAGITICSPEDTDELDIPYCPLYTMYVPKKAEYRIHFAFGNIIDIQRKIRDPNREPINWFVRSHANGFIFARNGAEDGVPQDVVTQAVEVINRCGLNFGAIDIIYNERRDEAYVLEVNTAPGLEGQTIESYANAFRHLV